MSFTPGPGTTYLLTSTQPIPSGTANGVLYLNGSKVVTSGSALTFNGSTLATTGALTVDGNTTLGNATTDTVQVNGYMGVGGAANSAIAILASSTALGSTTQHGVYSLITGTSAATSLISGFTSLPATAAASFTVADVYGYRASNATKGAGSTITNQHGVYIADQTQGTNNYGITSVVSSGTDKWNIYASGTAANYFAGNVGIGTASIGTGVTLHISGVSRIANSSGGLLQLEDTTVADGNVPFWVLQSDEGVFKLLSANRSGTGTTGSITRFSTSTVESVFNDTGADIDFRVESDTNTHALFVDAGNSRVGINNSTPQYALSVDGIVQALNTAPTEIAASATATVITPPRGFSYINISRSDTATYGLLLLVFRTTTTLEIVSTVSDKTSATYSASVSGTALQVTNSSVVTLSFYASGICVAFGTGN